MMCAMCGKDAPLVLAEIEGTELKVCGSCSKFGKVIRRLPPEKTARDIKKEQKKQEPGASAPPILSEKEVVEIVVKECGAIIRAKREKMGLKQKEFAKMVNEKESLIQNIETGRFIPSLGLAKKLEKFLKVRLIEEYEDSGYSTQKQKDEGLTLGDLVEIKKRG